MIKILQGWFSYLFTKPTELTKARRAICAKCKENLNGMCLACGCVIKAKTACENCECIIGKW